jgi:hypothetical protein
MKKLIKMNPRHILCLSLITALGLSLLPFAAGAADDELAGTYKLLSSTRKVLDTGEVLDTFGNHPTGFIMFDKEGRMLALIVRDDRPKPASIGKATPEQQAALYRSMLAYGGTYKFDGKSLENHIDISWNELWTDTTQIRDIRKEGDKLIFTTRPAPFSGDGKMSVVTLLWEKVK